ncbi:MAG TPA: T9SS type A sorting domain-containing protein [Candidatus Marinimicrobia bacterium]|nr:T9SS type A sorting domain-containing protein [Candidatus Neomarinimicrobiota bacterium]
MKTYLYRIQIKHHFMILLLCTLISVILPLSLQADNQTFFDLRNWDGENFVTSVKSQQGGTCWTFGAMAAIEGNMLLTGNWTASGEEGEPNLAEYHLDWWNGFNNHYNEDIWPQTGGLTIHLGGDYRVSSAYLSRGEGAVREIDAPTYENPSPRSDHSYHYFYVPHIEWYTAGSFLQNINLIKSKIMENGVMGTCMAYNSAFIQNNTHYQPNSSDMDPNHAVAIIGWNDHWRTQADEAGAWIVKNSWGTNWGDDGFFYISYYDKHATQHPEMGAVSFIDAQPLSYDKIYYHDYHGWRDTKAEIHTAMNAFTSALNNLGDEYLTAVSCFTAAENVQLIISVYDSFIDNVLTNLMYTDTAFFQHPGFHTIPLDEEIPLWDTMTRDFYVQIQMDRGGHAFDRTSVVPVLLGGDSKTLVESTAAPGESFFLSDTGWTDFIKIEPTGNFCIKALTNVYNSSSTDGHNPDIPTENRLMQNYPNPFNATAQIDYQLKEAGIIYLAIYDISGREVQLLVNDYKAAGYHSVSFNAKNLPSGVYFYRLESGNLNLTKKLSILK